VHYSNAGKGLGIVALRMNVLATRLHLQPASAGFYAQIRPDHGKTWV
jgi:hypothetical protein